MTEYGPKHPSRTRSADQVRAAADRAEGSASTPAASPIGDRGGVYSITTLAEMTGYHRDTISDWTRRKENPLPVASGGSHGVEYRISLRRLIEWREDQARVEGAKGPADGSFQFMGIKDPYKAIMARDKFVKMGESERALVHRAPMQAATQRAFGLVRQAVMAIPDRLARDMAGFPSDRVAAWRRDARGYCQEALADAASAIRDMAEAVAGDIEAAAMTEQPEAPAHLLCLPSADDLDVARILGLPALPVGDASIDDAYRELSTKGQVLYVRGVAVAADNLVPNAPVDIPTWAREHLRLPAAQSQRSGPLVMSPLQAAICRLWAVKRRVTFLKPPRFGSTLIMVVGLTYHAGHLGVDVLFYERTEGDAQDFHDKKLYPILTESPAMAHLIRADSRSGIQDAWMDRILTTGASIQLRGVSTNGSMRGIKGLFIGVDEASSAEYQAGTKGEKGEGSKLSLIIKRAQEFFDPCVYVGGTPTVVGSCITSEEYEKGDQCMFMMRSRCCPDLAQEFWDDIQQVDDRGARLGKGMRYTCDEVTGRIADVWYECAGCGSAIEETEKVAMMETGELVPQNADRAEPDHASVWAWAAYSTDPQSTWMHIARDHLAQVKDPEQRQPFMNLTRARPWKPDGPGVIDAHVLADRCEPYPAGHMPAGVSGTYVGIDTQEGGRSGKPRHEILTVGYGEGEESWILDRLVIDGIPGVDRDGKPCVEDLEPFSPDAARAIWAALDREWITADGEVLKPEMVAVDVGYDMNRALAFCHHKESRKRKVVAVKGRREAHGSRMPVITKRPSVSKSGYEFQPIGTQSAKDTIYRRLGYAVGSAESIHAPEHLRKDALWDQVAAESLHKDDKGRTWWAVTKEGTSNEAIDCLVYAYAALCLRKAKSRRIREASAIRLEARAAPSKSQIGDTAPVTLNASRPKAESPDDGGGALAGVRIVSRGRRIAPSLPAIEAEGRTKRRFGTVHKGLGW